MRGRAMAMGEAAVKEVALAQGETQFGEAEAPGSNPRRLRP
jgi:hypothetical protein